MKIKSLLVKIYLEYKRRRIILKINNYHRSLALKFLSDANGPTGWRGAIRTKCHIVEKGLTMQILFRLWPCTIEENN
jgi:hypothetical protein